MLRFGVVVTGLTALKCVAARMVDCGESSTPLMWITLEINARITTETEFDVDLGFKLRYAGSILR